MRNSLAKKQENHEVILDQASRLLRERGLQGVSVADLMQSAQLTHGGFYRHFTDKDDLVTQALSTMLRHILEAEVPCPSLSEFAEGYLSTEHRDHPESGCPFAALSGEVARGSTAGREVLTRAMALRIEGLAETAAGNSDAERRGTAIAAYASMIGALQLARLCTDPALSREILDSTLAAAVERTGPRRTRSGDSST